MTDGEGSLRDLSALAIRRYAAERDPFHIDHTVQVTSFGGSGTTALCDHLLAAGVDLQRGPAQWPFKHRRRPPEASEVPAQFRVLYLVGDPRNAVLSLFRRGIQVGHFEAMHERSPGPEAADRLQDLESFLAVDDDPFEFADHVDSWLHHPPGYPVLVIRQDTMSEHWAGVAEFIGLDEGRPGLPTRSRASDWTNEPPGIRERLDEIYGDLAARIADMPPLHVV